MKPNTEIVSNPIYASIWLGALIDGEGCVWVGKLKRGPAAGEIRRAVTIGMTDVEVIAFACACLNTLGVRHNTNTKERLGHFKTVYTVSVSGQLGIRKLASVLYLTHDKKRMTLADVLASYKPPVCNGCGVEYDQRTRGCPACLQRMKYRRKHGLLNTPGRTGRLPRAADASGLAL